MHKIERTIGYLMIFVAGFIVAWGIKGLLNA